LDGTIVVFSHMQLCYMSAGLPRAQPDLQADAEDMQASGSARCAQHFKNLHEIRSIARAHEERYKTSMAAKHSKRGMVFEPAIGMAVKAKTNIPKKDTSRFLLPYVFGRITRVSSGKRSCSLVCAIGTVASVPAVHIAPVNNASMPPMEDMLCAAGGKKVSLLEAARHNTDKHFALKYPAVFCMCTGKFSQKCRCMQAGQKCGNYCHPRNKMCCNRT
jgi:hypothetical protein